ncbi:MAG: pheromone-processing carboxypeptidase KEX1 [Benjaminiella poitrasii]|nr:MAG: pheromone-processing carboxypeptidase KEX1 [Benjaminiella poitrasii]
MRSALIGLLTLNSLYTVLAQTADEYKVTSLPGIDVDLLNFTQYAGHIELSPKSNANIFFWMIEREIKTEPEKLIIWLNGGPGCSSMDGLFLENGPFRVKKDLTLSLNEGGWQNYATNVFVDQPVGTGFSFANTDSYMHNMDEVTDEFVEFLDKLFVVFPQLRQQDLYIAGESYAGTYIPYFASRLLDLNKKEDRAEKYNLQGITIGNGWISSIHQYNAYYDYSMKYNLIDHDRVSMVSTHLKTCQDEMKKNEFIHISSCEKILTDVVDSSVHEDKNGLKKCINTYDIRSTEESFPDCGLSWPYELEEVTKYLRLKEVKAAIHAEKQILGWKECTSLVSTELHDDQSKPSYYLLPGILKEIPILLFSGEYDLICNYIGTEYLIGNMTWNGSRGFSKTTVREDWKIDNKIAGYYTQERNLTYVLIKDGSHMVPYDRPIETLDIINRFMKVGDNVVKGKQSQVGDHEEVQKPGPTPSSGNKTEDESSSNHPNQEENKREPYYNNWGTTVVVGVVLFSLTSCFCWVRKNNKRLSGSAAVEFGGAPQRERERPSKGLLGFARSLFNKKVEDRRKFRLDNNDESNEL